MAHLGLESAYRRGWAGAYAALARGEVDAERLRDLLVRFLPDADPLVFAVAVTASTADYVLVSLAPELRGTEPS